MDFYPRLTILVAILLGLAWPAQAQHKGISFQAVLKKPDGTYPTATGLSVTLQVLDPVTDCVLREEVHSGVNITNGYLYLVLASSTATTPAGKNPAVLLTIPQVFDNSTPRTGLNCVDVNDTVVATNQTYTPSSSHARKLRLRTVVAGDTIVADFNMRAIGFAVNAENLDGKAASAFVQTSAATTQANVESVFTRYATLDAILNGTFAGNAATATALAGAPGACPAGQYMSAMTASGAITCGTPVGGGGTVTSVTSANSYLSVATGTSTPVLTVNVGTAANTVAAGNDARFTDSRAPNGAAGGDLSGTYPNPTVAKVSGKTVTLTSPAAGDLLTYDGTKFVNSPPATAVDATKLPLAGGTMSGAIDMGSQNLTNLGFVTMSANKNLHLSNNAADPAGLVAADKGKMWFNSTSGQLKYWDGSAAQPLGIAGSGLQIFNAQTGSTQTLAIGTSGAAPAWTSASNTHTLNIPMASTASVTAGLISKTDYDAFNTKLGTSTTFAGDASGTYGALSVDKIKGKSVVPVAYAAGQTLRYDGTTWVNAVLGFSDLGSTPTTLAGYGITDAQSSTLSSGKILVGNASNVATAVTMSGDATLSNAGALTLATVPITKGGTGQTTKTAAFDALSPNTTKGDVTVFNGTNNLRLPAGTDTYVLTADSTQASGLKWAAIPGAISSLNGLTSSTQTFAIGTSGTAPAFSSATSTHTLNIPMASTASVTAGLISKTDYDAFNTKLGTSTTFAGDVSGAYNAISVDKIKGKAVTPTTYAAGQTLRYDGTQWVNSVLAFADLGSKPTTLAGYGITDAQSSTLTDGKILVGNASNVATAVTMSGDATLSNTGALTLATVPISKGGTGLTSFASDKLVTTSAAGAIQTSSCGLNQVISFTAGGAITCADVSSLAASFVNGGNSFGATATLGTNDANDLNFETNNVTRMTVLANGNIGVGTTTPSHDFDIVRADASPVIMLKNTSSTTAQYPGFYAFNYSGGLGGYPVLSFGTARGSSASPSAVLTNDTLGMYLTQGNYGGGFTDATAIAGYAGEDWSTTNKGSYLTFSTNVNGTNTKSERMRIHSNGLVGIGTQSPKATLDVSDTSTTTSGLIIPRAATFTGTNVNGMIRYNTTSTLFEFRQNGAWVNYTTVSDGRLKTNVVPVSNGLEIVEKLRPVFYDWDRRNPKASAFEPRHQVGFIAQEVEKVLPEVVNRGEDSYRSLEYGKMVSVVVAAVKELYQQVRGIHADNAQRDQKISALETENRALITENAAIKSRLDAIEKKLLEK